MELIESRTQDLPRTSRSIHRDYRSAARTEVNYSMLSSLSTLNL